jgi:type II secretory pathway pseudopilin PulG
MFRIFGTLIVIAIMGVLAAIAIPNLLMAPRGARDSRIAGDTKHTVTQAIVYAKDKGVYPTSITVLREGGYTALSDKDLWGNEWVLSPVLTRGGIPREGDNVYVFSTGPEGTGVYPEPFTHDTGENESIGYSSVHGSWIHNLKYSCQKIIRPPLNMLCFSDSAQARVNAGLIILGTLSVLCFVAASWKSR